MSLYDLNKDMLIKLINTINDVKFWNNNQLNEKLYEIQEEINSRKNKNKTAVVKKLFLKLKNDKQHGEFFTKYEKELQEIEYIDASLDYRTRDFTLIIKRNGVKEKAIGILGIDYYHGESLFIKEMLKIRYSEFHYSDRQLCQHIVNYFIFSCTENTDIYQYMNE
jgi:hypothetical protein